MSTFAPTRSWKLLESGAVLVDLPGVRDANMARGAVAEAYMKRCDQLWICADITRAVDNKTAKVGVAAAPSSARGADGGGAGGPACLLRSVREGVAVAVAVGSMHGCPVPAAACYPFADAGSLLADG